jgi:hypothetical protein
VAAAEIVGNPPQPPLIRGEKRRQSDVLRGCRLEKGGEDRGEAERPGMSAHVERGHQEAWIVDGGQWSVDG